MGVGKVSFYQYIPGLIIVGSVSFTMLTGIKSFSYLSVFYWSVYRSDLVPISLLVGAGLLCDSVCSHFLGEETFLYLSIMGIIYLDRRFLLHKEFAYLWKSITALVIIIFIGKWFLSLKLEYSFSEQQAVFDTAVGIFSFPIFVRLIAPLYGRVAAL